MVPSHITQSKLLKFAVICVIIIFFSILFKSDTGRLYSFKSTTKKEIKIYDVGDIVERMEDLEQRFANFERQAAHHVRDRVFITSIDESKDNITIKLNKTFKLNSFWTGDDDIREFDYLYNGRKDHKTCLVTAEKCKRPYKLLILITTHVGHHERREIIRRTWGMDPKDRWKTFFLIGRTNSKHELESLSREITEYGDIILGDVFENFYNLTAKVQAGFEWSVRYCQYEFLLKGDDDVFVNMPALFSFFDNEETPNVELYAGNVQYQAHVFRSGKYGIQKHEFKRKTYPRYCSGGGFILSRDVVNSMIDILDKVKGISIDDAYVGILALKAGIDAIHNDNFRMFESEKDCPYRAESIIHHPVKSSACMQKLYTESLKESN